MKAHIEGISNQLARMVYGDEEEYQILYRPNSSDENVIKEVIDKQCYRRIRVGFEVKEGETWLDLGANIGAFAVYCHMKGAKAVDCYEPEPQCFNILQKNVPWRLWDCIPAAVSTSFEDTMELWHARQSDTSHSRSTLYPPRGGWFDNPVRVNNVYAGKLLNKAYDGVKMDIEGAEFDIIDQGLIPRCNKLVLEYHTSRDKSTRNLTSRLDKLHSLFHCVVYPDNLARLKDIEGEAKTFYDRLIFCIGRKS